VKTIWRTLRILYESLAKQKRVGKPTKIWRNDYRRRNIVKDNNIKRGDSYNRTKRLGFGDWSAMLLREAITVID